MNYSNLRSKILAAIKYPPKITAQALQEQLINIVNDLDLGALFLGVATPSLTPNTEANAFYFGLQPGTYINFPTINGETITVDSSEVAIIVRSGNYWSKIHIMTYPSIDPITKHWMIGGQDTGVLAEGTNGVTPHIDQETGNWFIGTTNTGVHAQGTPGADAYQPFKGTFASQQDLEDAFPTPNEGDTAHVEATVNGDDVLEVWDVVNGAWHNTNRTADSPVFGSGQMLSSVNIDNTRLSNPATGSLPKAEDVMQLKAKLEGVTANEVKASYSILTGPNNKNGYIKKDGNTITFNETTNQTDYIYCKINVVGYRRLRFKGFTKNSSTTFAYGFLDSNENLIDNTVKNYDVYTSQQQEYILKEYIIDDIPTDAAFFGCAVKIPNAITENDFYCYLQSGKSAGDEFNAIKDNISTIDNEIYGYEGEVFEDEITENWQSSGAGRGISSGNQWYDVNGTESKFVPITPNTRIKISNVGEYGGLYALLRNINNYSVNGTSVNYATGSGRTLLRAGEFAILDIPSDGNYLYVTTKASGNFTQIIAFTPTIKHIDGLNDKIEHITPGITHLKGTVGETNVVRRMRKFTDIKWAPAFEFSRGSSGGGQSFFQDKFLSGVEYKGIPYSRSYRNNGDRLDGSKDYGYHGRKGFKVGTRIAIETFITAVNNRGTVMEKESIFNRGTHDSSFYANICAGSVTAAIGSDYYTTNELDNEDGEIASNVVGFVGKGRIGVEFGDVPTWTEDNLIDLRLGDVLAKYGVHTAMVTDVIIQNGIVTHIEVSESTTQGNANYNELGGILGGVARRLWYTVDEFMSVWDGYKVLKYIHINITNYIPSPYVPMPDEHQGYAPYTMACLPYMGNGFRYVAGATDLDDILKIVVTVKGNESTTFKKKKIVIERKNGDSWEEIGREDVIYTEWVDETAPYVYVNLSDAKYKIVGEYRAFAYVNQVDDLEDPDNGRYYTTRTPKQGGGYDYDASSGKTSTCKWSVVNNLAKLVDY